MANIITKQSKGSPLTHLEVDNNFSNINNDLATKAGLADLNKFTGRIQIGNLPNEDIGVTYGRFGIHNEIGASAYISTKNGAILALNTDGTNSAINAINSSNVIYRVNGAEVSRYTATTFRISTLVAIGSITTPQANLHVSGSSSPIVTRFQTLNGMTDFGQFSGNQYIQAKTTAGASATLQINPEGGQVFVNNKRVQLEEEVRVSPIIKTYVQNYFVVSLANGDIKAWGFNQYGQLGNGTTTSSPIPMSMKFSSTTTRPPSNANVSAIELVGSTTYILYDNGWLYACGGNANGQLGNGGTTSTSFLSRIDFFVNNNILVESIKGSGNSQTPNGATVLVKGNNNSLYLIGSGYTGNGTALSNKTTPTLVYTSPTLFGYDISSDNVGINVFVNDGGVLRAWGSNHNGCLGVNTTTPVTTVTNCIGITGGINQVRNMTGYQSGLATYFGSTIVLNDNGELFASGYNANGQLGLGNTSSRSTFTKITSVTDYILDVFAPNLGPYVTFLAYSNTAKIWTWGYGATGIRGDGSVADKPTPSSLSGQYNGVYTPAAIPNQTVSYIILNEAFTNNKYVLGYVNAGEANMVAETTNGVTISTPKLMDMPKTYNGESFLQFFGTAYNGTSSLFALSTYGRLVSTGYNVNGELGLFANPTRTFGWKQLDLN